MRFDISPLEPSSAERLMTIDAACGDPRMRQALILVALMATAARSPAVEPRRATFVSIEQDKFTINGQPTYQGRTWRGKPIEGLLMNSRMVQATFDDRNPETAARWAYPDTNRWDADRNTATTTTS